MIYESLIWCCWMGMFSKLQVKTVRPLWEQMDGENSAAFQMIKMAEKIIPASRSVLCIHINIYLHLTVHILLPQKLRGRLKTDF